MATTTQEGLLDRDKPALGVRHTMLVLVSPRAVFARVEDTGAYGWALVMLLGLFVLIGYAQVHTGLIDADVDRQTEQKRAKIEEAQGNLIDRVQLRSNGEDRKRRGVLQADYAFAGHWRFPGVYAGVVSVHRFGALRRGGPDGTETRVSQPDVDLRLLGLHRTGRLSPAIRNDALL